MSDQPSMRSFIKMFVSAETFAAMEADSRQWMAKCPNCNFERSIWEMGGIRYKAAGNPRVYRVCPNCNQRQWHTIYKKE
jgi:hypothetical protein